MANFRKKKIESSSWRIDPCSGNGERFRGGFFEFHRQDVAKDGQKRALFFPTVNPWGGSRVPASGNSISREKDPQLRKPLRPAERGPRYSIHRSRMIDSLHNSHSDF